MDVNGGVIRTSWGLFPQVPEFRILEGLFFNLFSLAFKVSSLFRELVLQCINSKGEMCSGKQIYV